jgi:hypothetical protein
MNDIRVPQLHGIVDEGSTQFWQDNIAKFPEGQRQKGTLVRMERILPLPKVIRKALVVHFYPWKGGVVDYAKVDAIVAETPNKHCLTRTYLGKDKWAYTESFSLRNLPLCLESMERLCLDVTGLATSMGKAFAIMHWGAGIDGDDVEFVLGTSPEQGDEIAAFDSQHRVVQLYLIDFGQCAKVDLSGDVEMVYQKFRGAMVMGDNQYFIPHYRKSPGLWGAFKDGYTEAGRAIVAHRGLKFDVEEFLKQYEEYAEDFLLH